MKYSKEDIMQYVQEEDVKFIRLAFCDIFGRQKNISIMAEELPRAFEYGIPFDASAIAGFGDETHSDLLLFPDADTLMPLPWRPEHGKVVRMFSDILYPDKAPFECDSRRILKEALSDAKAAGYTFAFGAEQEFYLFELDEEGAPTKTPYDTARYMDIAPDDRGENIRREICLTLEQMGIHPECSHHEEGPGQNEIDFRYSDPLSAADNAMTFQNVVKTAARRNGVYADFGPKPLEDKPGNGFHINMSLSSGGSDALDAAVAGILDKAGDMTLFLNPVQDSYRRFGAEKAPQYVSWSKENRSQLIRIPAAGGEFYRMELRSPDPAANPYLAFALMMWASLRGVEQGLALPPAVDLNLYKASAEEVAGLEKLPETLREAQERARASAFIQEHIPAAMLNGYCASRDGE